MSDVKGIRVELEGSERKLAETLGHSREIGRLLNSLELVRSFVEPFNFETFRTLEAKRITQRTWKRNSARPNPAWRGHRETWWTRWKRAGRDRMKLR